MVKLVSFHMRAGRAVRLIVVFLLALSLILAGKIPAAHADARILYATPQAIGTGSCGSWGNSCTLQTALTNAISGDQIWASAGRHTPGPVGSPPWTTFQLKDGVAVYGGFAGTETLLEERDWIANITILSGDLNGDDVGFTNNSENSYHVVTGITGATLDGVTVSGGGNGDSPFGGGMINDSSNPTVTNVIFSGNAAHSGGGMYNWNSSPILTHVTFSGNKAAAHGGGILNEQQSSPTLIDVSFTDNTAGTGYSYGGGGMVNSYLCNPNLTNVTFTGNSAWTGGAMVNVSNSNTVMNHVIFKGNWSTSDGGGIRNDAGGNLMLNHVDFNGNTAYGNGGGMINMSNAYAVLTDVTFTGNKATNGGGMGNFTSSPTLNNVTFIDNSSTVDGGGMGNYWDSNPTLANVAFINNKAGQNGGGMLNITANPEMINVTFSGNIAVQIGGGMGSFTGSQPMLTQVTFTGNTAAAGGAMYNYTDTHPTVRNSILWGNHGGEIGNAYNSSITIINSDIQGGYTGAGNINGDPLFAPLGDYGGQVQTLALLPGSPALDATNSNCSPTDARDLPRSSPACDLGAFESQGFNLLKTSGDGQSARIGAFFTQPLCLSITAAQGSEPVNGGKITFSAPASGPSATFNPAIALIAGGAACTSSRANALDGSYIVTARAGGKNSITFNLSNTALKTYLPWILK